MLGCLFQCMESLYSGMKIITQTATKKFLPKKQVNIEHIFDIHLYPKIYEKNLLISIDYGIESSIRQ